MNIQIPKTWCYTARIGLPTFPGSQLTYLNRQSLCPLTRENAIRRMTITGYGQCIIIL